jgi:hypothetical protein
MGGHPSLLLGELLITPHRKNIPSYYTQFIFGSGIAYILTVAF